MFFASVASIFHVSLFLKTLFGLIILLSFLLRTPFFTKKHVVFDLVPFVLSLFEKNMCFLFVSP